MKFISGRDWGADAKTLRTTYISLVRPVLEYGFQIYHVASNTNLQKLERVQLSAARIITELRRSTPSNIVLYEADLQPLRDRCIPNLIKYFSKLYSYRSQHRTANFLCGGKNTQRLKRYSPLGHAEKLDVLQPIVSSNSLKPIASPLDKLSGVYFHTELLTYTNKSSQHPEFLRQAALEVINNIPSEAVLIYTDGSKDENGHTGSGVVIKSGNEETFLSQRNPDFSSVFGSELIAIDMALGFSLDHQLIGEIWLLVDSRSVIQYLENWRNIVDQRGIRVFEKLKLMSKSSAINFQWIPSHVNLKYNDIADSLAKKGSSLTLNSAEPLTFQEMCSRSKALVNSSWKLPPSHPWYLGSGPGGSLSFGGARQDQTALSRFKSGHLKSLRFSGGNKTFPICTKCNSSEATAEHLLRCIGFSRENLLHSPNNVLDGLKANGLMDLI
ncbi:uncharacterized protein LOC129962845 [Argiope bruennichi]|uniref:uncharacterized protein LOC129962845 n=1 Tax=Argiope bruennichi TaxID=94029 RepID=UPI00249443FF|nr:uncharacterized protein LOC129962845 [Argiope bruennichi]